MRQSRHRSALGAWLLSALLVLLSCSPVLAQGAQVRNVILLIGDGMGIGHITAARISAGSPDSLLNLDTMPITGLVKTHSTSSLVTDSAAAATALATGLRTDNGRIATTPDNRPLKTLLEMAEERGKGTGVVSTSKLTDATPASFLAHSASRLFEREIAEQIIASGVDILLGGGSELFGAHPFTRQPKAGSLISQAVELGYEYLNDREQLLSLPAEPGRKLLGLFSTGHLSYDHERFAFEPSLAEMTSRAIDFLALYHEGFFLVVEGSKIDKASHYHMTEEALGEVIAFDQAVGKALEYARFHRDTLVIVVADHEIGGIAPTGGSPGGERVQYGWLSADHTGSMVVVYAYGPGAEVFSGTQHLTDIGRKVGALLGFEPLPVFLEPNASADLRPAHVVFIIVDGFDPEYFSFGLPNLEAFAREGVWIKEAQTIMPAATTAAVTSLITGCYPLTHGVPNNVFYDPALNVRRESPREVSVPNIGELFQEQGLSTISVNHFMMEGRGADVHVTGGWNTAISRLESDLPTLLVFIDQNPDSVGHQRGGKSTAAANAMKRTDRSFGTLLETLKELGIYDRSLIIVTADHGMTHIEKRIGDAVTRALNVLGLKVEYLSSGTSPAADTDIVWFHMVTGAAVVYLKPISPEQEELIIDRILGVEGVDSVWNREKMLAEGMHPLVGDLWINLADGYGLAAQELGGHASIYQRSVPLLIKGPGIKKDVVIAGERVIRTVDVVPTILYSMGFDVPEYMDGRVLHEIYE